MNAAQFSAGTFYRYANIGLGGLLENLDGDTATARELTAEFLRAFVTTVPSGKQNATAAMTIPDLVYIAVRSDRPVSFAPAFEKPVAQRAGLRGAVPRRVLRVRCHAERVLGNRRPGTGTGTRASGASPSPASASGRLPRRAARRLGRRGVPRRRPAVTGIAAAAGRAAAKLGRAQHLRRARHAAVPDPLRDHRYLRRRPGTAPRRTAGPVRPAHLHRARGPARRAPGRLPHHRRGPAPRADRPDRRRRAPRAKARRPS